MVSLDILAAIVQALSPLFSVVLAFFVFGGVSLAVVIPFLFIVRAGIPRI
jgi:hypothetical protein